MCIPHTLQELPSVLFTTQSSSGKEGSNEGRWHGNEKICSYLPGASFSFVQHNLPQGRREVMRADGMEL
jgi:hypothetical protein